MPGVFAARAHIPAAGDDAGSGGGDTSSLLACTHDAPGPLVPHGCDTDVRHEPSTVEPPTLRLRERALPTGARTAPSLVRRVLGTATRR